jgi:hypothetical protein
MSRYTQDTPPATVEKLCTLLDVLNTSVDDEIKYGQVARLYTPYEDGYVAQLAVEAIDKLVAEDTDPNQYLLLLTYDLLVPDILHHKDAPVPEYTAGLPDEGNCKLYPKDLGKGRDYWAQWVVSGPVCELVGNGWGTYYYNDAQCQTVAKNIKTLLGSTWTVSTTLKTPYQGIPTCLVLCCTSKIADQVTLEIIIAGQGQVHSYSEMLDLMAQNVEFFNVVDTDCNNRIRCGSTNRDTVWQYP